MTRIQSILLSPLRWFFEGLYVPVYKRQLAKNVAALCDSHTTILDVGSDDGNIGEKIMKHDPTISMVGIDIQTFRPSAIPRTLYDGKTIPFPDAHFDIVMALDVLHHTDNIPAMLKEMTRVSKRYIIIKDLTFYGRMSHFSVAFSDWLTNVYRGIHCVFNYATPTEWTQYFTAANLRIVMQPTHISFGYGMNEHFNPIFKLEKT